MSVETMLVGSASHETGGIARYVTEQRRRLPGDARVYDLSVPRGEGYRRFLVASLVSLWAMVRFPFRRRPDVVHVHTSHRFSFYRASWFVFVAAHLWNRPVVIHVHGSSFDEFLATDSWAVATLQRATFGSADAVVALSPYWRDVLSSVVPADRIVVLPNAVDASEYDPDPDDRPHVAFVSNLIPRKGVREFVTAVDELLADESRPDFRVTVAGAGPLADRVEDLAERHETVEYLGFVSEERKRRLLDRATIYALPSYDEGLPIAMLEGMAGGNAVVATRVGAVPSVVGDEGGHVVEPRDADALTDALRDLLSDPESTAEMGRRNRRLIVEDYDWSSVAPRLADLYRRLDAGESVATAGETDRGRAAPAVATDGTGRE